MSGTGDDETRDAAPDVGKFVDDGRGRSARYPHQLTARGLKDVTVRAAKNLSGHNILLVAAGLAFYAMLSVFPLLLAIVSIYGLAANPEDVRTQIGAVSGALPPSARELLGQELTTIASAPRSGLSWGVVLSVLGFLWTASGGTSSLITGMNIAYQEKQKRSWLKQTSMSILFAIIIIVSVIVAIGTITVLPAILRAVGLGDAGTAVIAWLRWPVLALLVLGGLALLYHYAPDRTAPKWRWVTWGSVFATTLWIGASLLFSWYTSNFGRYDKTYGALGAIIVLLMWFWISALAILGGGELNAEMEHQTAVDSTVGKPKPMGRRGAVVADTLGAAT